jgi:hypothetical protein
MQLKYVKRSLVEISAGSSRRPFLSPRPCMLVASSYALGGRCSLMGWKLGILSRDA